MGDEPAGGLSSTELRLGGVPTRKKATVELSAVEDSFFGMAPQQRSHDDDSSFDNTHNVSYSNQLTDVTVTGKSDDDIWIWIIEYIAKFKEEIWMLHDVFEMGRQLPDDLGERTNEMVAFRCLAYLVDPNHTQNNVTSDTEPKVEFDLSDSCEYVLQCVLDEIPLSDLKPGAPGLSKWNLLYFITHKRHCLPECALELLREAYHQESNGLYPGKGLYPSKGQEAMRIKGGSDEQSIHGLDGENTEEGVLKEGEWIPEGPGDGGRLLGDENDTSICEMNRCDSMIPIGSEENDDGNQDTCMVDENPYAKADNVYLDATEVTDLLEDDNGHTIGAEGGCNLPNEYQDENAELSRSPVLYYKEHMASVALQMIGYAGDGNGQMELPDNFSVLPLETTNHLTLSTAGLESQGKRPSSDDPEKVKGQLKLNSLREVLSIEKVNPNHREKFDGAMVEGDPCSPSACMQCKKSGELLACSSEDCPVMIHGKCLDHPPTYDDVGNFYCPPCSYVRVSSEYLESKAQVAEAKKKLVLFLDLLNSKPKQKLPC